MSSQLGEARRESTRRSRGLSIARGVPGRENADGRDTGYARARPLTLFPYLRGGCSRPTTRTLGRDGPAVKPILGSERRMAE